MIILSVDFKNYNAFHNYQNMTNNLLDFFINIQIKRETKAKF